MTAVVFGWGVVVGYFIAYLIIDYFERHRPIHVDSFKLGSLNLNREETDRVLAVLKDAVERKAAERRK